MAENETHWNDVYTRSSVTEVSWFHPEPDLALALLTKAGIRHDDPIVDVGGGASVLVGALLDEGYEDLTVLDVASDALATSRRRLGEERAERVSWVVADLLDWHPPRRYRLWHDRAVFHFLTEAADRDRYRAVLDAALAPGGHLIIGTFADDGPTRCSGLPTARYSPDELAAQFPGCRVVESTREEHHTPTSGIQPFTWLLLAADAK